MTLQELQTKLRNLQNEKIRLSTQLAGLLQQESGLKAQLAQMGVTDIGNALNAMTQESESLKVSIQSALVSFQV